MAPVSHGKFSYNVDTFYVEASGNIHRRAIPAELRALFDASIPDSNQRPDHPAHWFEAQLLHYGLSPSKAKATAKMRLSDAIQDGALEVPLELVQMEKRLKREWKRQDEAARTLPSGLAHLPTPVTTSRTTTTKTATTTTVATSLPIPRKRARDIEDDEVGERPSVKQTARRVGFLQSNITQSTGPRPQKTQRPELPNRARRRQGSGNTVPQLQTARKDVVSSGSGKSAHITPLTANSHRQTVSTVEALLIAGGNSDLSGRIGQVGIQSSNPSSWDNNEMHDYDDSYDDEYFGDSSDPDDDQEILENYLSSDNLPCQDPFDDRYPSSSSNSMSARLSSGSYADPRGPPPIYNQLFESQPPQRRLGLLKGEYDVASNEPTGNHINGNGPRTCPKICLTLSGEEMFGSITLGILEGILWIPARPKKASEEKIPFQCYGKVSGQLVVSHENSGWIRFLGEGEIEGEISCFRQYSFVGQRISGENTSSVRSALDLRREWLGYIGQINEAQLNGLIE